MNSLPVDSEEARLGAPPRVLGRYRIVAELGRGSTSIVYLAAVGGAGGFKKFFALKVLRRGLAVDPDRVAMFLAEARLGAQFDHPNVVSTLEIEEGGPLPFIVMEYLDGGPLQQILTTARIAFKPLPLHMHLAVLSGALEGLGYAHGVVGPSGAPLSVVHRDVSPHNVFVTTSGTPKLLDFGFAQTTDSADTTLTSAARVAYMSPEQAVGQSVDARSDLFSVGVMLWEAMTRRRFWPEEATKEDILAALRSAKLPANRVTALAKASSELQSMILKATAPHPADRYETASAFQVDLRNALGQVTPPAFALRELGQRVVSLLATERARLQRAIDEDRDEARVPVETPTEPVLPPSPPAPRVQPEAVPSIVPSSGPLPSYPLPSTEGARRLQARGLGIAAGLIALVAVVVLLFASPRADRAPGSEPRAPRQAPADGVGDEKGSALPAAEGVPPPPVEAPPATPGPSAPPSPPVSPAAVTESAAPAPLAVELSVRRPMAPAHPSAEPWTRTTTPTSPTDGARGPASGASPGGGAGGAPRSAPTEPPTPSARPPHVIDLKNPYGP